ncbi:MAG TPA: MerR family transcriptional regulator [Gammaproteobacteria bacterium]|nr:MerR family transcriptional regulator [Gammaproteobacteria bacterium]
MRNDMLPVLTGLLLDEENTLTLSELCRACAVHAEWVMELVDEGVLEPVNPGAGQWYFPAISLQRALTIQRLQRDLGINLAGAALVMELMDEIHSLRTRLQTVEHER